MQLVQDGLSQLDPTCANSSGPQQTSGRALNGRRTSSNRPRPCPSSFENILGWAQSSLTNAGIAPERDEEVLSVSTAAQDDWEEDAQASWSLAVRNVLSLPRSTTQALLDLAASEVICMYPCVEMDTIRQNLDNLYDTLSDPPSRHGSEAPLTLMDVEILKAVLLVGACASQACDVGLVDFLESSVLWSVSTFFSQDAVSEEDLIMMCLFVGICRSVNSHRCMC